MFRWISLLRSLSNLTLNVPSGGACVISLSNLCQYFSTLIAKNIILISSLNIPSYSLIPLLLCPVAADIAHVQLFIHQYPKSFLQGYSQSLHSPECIDFWRAWPGTCAGPCICALLKLIKLSWAYSLSLSVSLWMASLPSGVSVASLEEY